EVVEGQIILNRAIKYLIAITICIVFSSYFPNHPIEAKSIQDYEQDLKELEEEANNLQSKKNKIESNKDNVQGEIKENEDSQSKVEKEMDKIESDLDSTQSDIDMKENELAITEKEIEKLKQNIEKIEERIEKRKELLKDRLRDIQENGGNILYLSVVLGSQNLADLIVRSTAVNSIMDQDKSIMEEHARDKKELEEKE